MGDGNIGRLDWDDCTVCNHYREKEGGCNPIDEEGPDILGIDIGTELVICEKFEQRKI